ncbi:glycoside hydrolase [Seonamhaeicola sediminis]|uniref:Glycoside hydrolase n=1 Tax=Seonamhaeicola sediminis TaxID=2528206 RepID=A0A562YIG1_9FLAO|nr:glycosyl hydrolase [Seonamhaeicola sediminis]TWO34558.1 glycoside hydrolase [Seonamhaeicola sediminis]
MRKYILLISLSIIFCLVTSGQTESTELEQNFKNPPASVKPRTWMHAIDGNMTKEGLTKDLEAMQRVGIGGVLLFNIDQKIPDGKIKYASPEHHEMLKHAAAECERLGLSFGVHNCDGWSSSGGPWISPEQSMKMVVWNELQVKGGDIDVQLPQPTKRNDLYKDIAVLAYPAFASELDDLKNQPVISSSNPQLKTEILTDNQLDGREVLSKKEKDLPWLMYAYPKAKTIRSVLIVCNQRDPIATLQVSDNGIDFTDVRDLYTVRTGKREWTINDSFEPVTAKYFKITFNQTMSFQEAKLSATQSIHNVMGRISMGRTEDVKMTPIGQPSADMIINPEQVLDLSEYLQADGTLKTTLPEGDWTILRFGYTSTGAYNNPASDSGRGLECDKFNRPALKKHYDAFVKKVVENTKALAPNAMQYSEIDSYEMGGQNWTDDYEQLFKEKYGYDIIDFLPLYAGRFVESPEVSNAVLWDVRQFNCDLMTENYFGYFAELCREDGIQSYIEPYGFGPVNDLDVGAKADINMGEFWMGREMTMVQSAVSASHIYGKKVTSAESFTSNPQINWKGHPALAKTSGDLAWVYGINEFMFHRFTHQANPNVAPGMTMGRWGFHFDRVQPWWDNAGTAWFSYMMRGQYLLRQGVPVSDFLVFVGDGSPNSVYLRKDFEPTIPAGTNFDCSNADVLINRVSLKNKTMVLPEGTTYKALVLKNSKVLSLKSLQRIYEIAQAGVPVIGEMPQQAAGYLHTAEQKALFAQTLASLTALPNVYAGFAWQQMMEQESISSDFSIKGREDIPFIHRADANLDIYFFFNPDSSKQRFECSFNVNGKIPELWNPMNGEVVKTAQFIHEDGKTKVWINLEGEESVFVIFRSSSKGVSGVTNIDKIAKASYSLTVNNKLQEEKETESIALAFENDWTVTFPSLRLEEKSFKFSELIDWSKHDVEGIKYYSGTAIYENEFKLSNKQLINNQRFMLYLGKISIAAKVVINGTDLGVLWMPPFELDITEVLKKGKNTISLEVTNQWTNRLIGDEQYPNETNFDRNAEVMPYWFLNNEPAPLKQRSTFTITNFYGRDKTLLPAGLIGPITIKTTKKIIIK